jgi:circadian clock protein KaiC
MRHERPTLVSGRAGCDKTHFAAEFLARGAEQFGEPGVFCKTHSE